MKRENALISNTLILALGKFLPQLTAVITLPIYTGKLTTGEYGRYDIINTVVYVLDIIILLQIHQAVFRFLIDVRGTKKQDVYITNTYLFELIPSVLASAVFGLAYYKLGALTVFLLGFYMFINLQYSVVGQVARGLGKNKHYAIGSIIQSVLNMVLVVVLLSGLDFGFNGLIISLDIAYLAATVFQFAACRQASYIKKSLFDFAVIKEMIAYSWPMVPNTISIWVVNTCNKYIIRFIMGIEFNGIFAAAQKIPNIFSMAYSTFNMAWQESASISLKDDDCNAYYNNIFTALFNFLSGCMLVLISATPILFAILINENYDAAYYQIPLLYIGVFLSSISSFFGSIYVANKATKAVGVSSAIGAVINCIVNIAMISWAGLYAASVSTIISYLILVVYRAVDIERKKFAHLSYDFRHISVCFALIILCAVLCYQRVLVFNIINILIGISGFIVLNRSLIKQVLRKFIKR